MKNIKTHIRNPLTIIAIFAGLAEISGTAILPLLPNEAQSIYLWFLMIFPILLVLLFFLTLNFNHKVLYAPSDFLDESNFMNLLDRRSLKEKEEDIRLEVDEIVEDFQGINIDKKQDVLTKFDISARYLFSEQMVLSIIEAEFHMPILINPVIYTPNNRTITIDGILEGNKELIGVEVKYISSTTNLENRLKHAQNQIEEFFRNLPEPRKSAFMHRAIIAFVIDTKEEQEKIVNRWSERINALMPSNFTIRYYNIEEYSDPNNLLHRSAKSRAR